MENNGWKQWGWDLLEKVAVVAIEILTLERVCLPWPFKHFWRKKPRKKSADVHPR
jgi:hypothetical protein